MDTKTVDTLENIGAILVTLKIGDDQALFVMLASDGCINRLGTGAVENEEHTMCIGNTDPTLFEQLRSKITPDLIRFGGRMFTAPNPQGKPCKLQIGFKRKEDGREMMMGFAYGAESEGPPPVVCKFVLAAVEATEPWYKEQKAMVAKNS